MTASEEVLLELERQGWEALPSSQGGAYYREHLTDNALMAFPFGVLTRAETIDAMESAPPGKCSATEDSRSVRRTIPSNRKALTR